MHDAAPTRTLASISHTTASTQGCCVSTETERPLRALAHELNSLLDGSLRTLRLTRRAMGLGEPTPETVAAERDLEAVETAMVRMADALAKVLAAPSQRSTAEILTAFADQRPLAEVASTVVESLAAVAAEAKTTVRLECDPSVTGLAAGPLEPLLRNTIRNAIEACGRSPLPSVPGDVSVSLRRRGDRLLIDVLDNGPGVRAEGNPHGHGIGLQVAREVVRSVQGTLDLSNVPFGRGALVRADVPAHPLLRSRAA